MDPARKPLFPATEEVLAVAVGTLKEIGKL